jgi:hypothetical protein
MTTDTAPRRPRQLDVAIGGGAAVVLCAIQLGASPWIVVAVGLLWLSPWLAELALDVRDWRAARAHGG